MGVSGACIHSVQKCRIGSHPAISILPPLTGLTPPATPPHQLWKPLAAVSLLAKAKSPKSTAQEGTLKPEGVTEAKHPAAARLHEGVRGPSPVHVGSGDHDYCVRSRTRQVACHSLNNLRGKRSSIPPHKTRPDSPWVLF